jgi:hypothetical protein
MKVNLVLFKRLVKLNIVENVRKLCRKKCTPFNENKTWELINLPKGKTTLQNKWV